MNDESSVESENEASVASENWENLFEKLEEIKIDAEKRLDVQLTDRKADLYDFADAILMRNMRERLVEALQVVVPIIPQGDLRCLRFGNKFFMTMTEQQQRSFFLSIFKLPVSHITVGEDKTDEWAESPAITISTSALLETLPRLHTSVWFLAVNNFALTRQSDVQALSNAIRTRCVNLGGLQLESIECPVDDCNKEDSDEPNGFLDPLFNAATCPRREFSVSTKTRSVHSTLVSPKALRSLFDGSKELRLRLCGLGLTDNHVLAIVDGMSIPLSTSVLEYLNLDSNPAITAQGYGALFNLANRDDCFGYSPTDDGWIAFCVDDKAWEAELNLVTEMNSEHRRLQYLTNGTFTSDERRWLWLERVVNLPSTGADDIYDDSDDDDMYDYDEDGVYHGYRAHDMNYEYGDDGEDDEDGRRYEEDENKKRDAKYLNFIWYTLRQNPEMMQVFQAPTSLTSKKKRKRT